MASRDQRGGRDSSDFQQQQMGFFLSPELVLVLAATAAFWCLLKSAANDPPPRFRSVSALVSDEQRSADPRVRDSSAQTLSDVPRDLVCR